MVFPWLSLFAAFSYHDLQGLDLGRWQHYNGVHLAASPHPMWSKMIKKRLMGNAIWTEEDAFLLIMARIWSEHLNWIPRGSSRELCWLFPANVPYQSLLMMTCIVLRTRENYLVGGLEHQFYFPIYWECHHPNWLSYFSKGWPNHQPAMPLQMGKSKEINHHTLDFNIKSRGVYQAETAFPNDEQMRKFATDNKNIWHHHCIFFVHEMLEFTSRIWWKTD